jgi:epsilon-lactone hydrolase
MNTVQTAARSEPVCIAIIVTGFTALSTVVIQCAGAEILRTDSRHLAEGLVPAGGQVELDQHPGLWHDFQLDAGLMSRANEALHKMGAVPAMRLGLPLA